MDCNKLILEEQLIISNDYDFNCDKNQQTNQRNWMEITFKKNYIIFTNSSALAGYDTRSIFKRSLTGLDSEFSFS